MITLYRTKQQHAQAVERQEKREKSLAKARARKVKSSNKSSDKSSDKSKKVFKRKAIPCYKVYVYTPQGTSVIDLKTDKNTDELIRDYCIQFRYARGRKGTSGCKLEFYTTKDLGVDSTKLSIKEQHPKYDSLKVDVIQSTSKGSRFKRQRLFYTVNF